MQFNWAGFLNTPINWVNLVNQGKRGKPGVNQVRGKPGKQGNPGISMVLVNQGINLVRVNW
jgi:hypothetical protein